MKVVSGAQCELAESVARLDLDLAMHSGEGLMSLLLHLLPLQSIVLNPNGEPPSQSFDDVLITRG